MLINKKITGSDRFSLQKSLIDFFTIWQWSLGRSITMTLVLGLVSKISKSRINRIIKGKYSKKETFIVKRIRLFLELTVQP
jgi:hypothetical protein